MLKRSQHSFILGLAHLTCAALLAGASGATADDLQKAAQPTVFGFTSEAAAQEVALEQRFDASLSPADLS